jgi:lysophospholipase L1-like esterase
MHLGWAAGLVFFSQIAFAQIKILPLGDSITYGLSGDCSYALSNCGGYRTTLYEDLSKAGFTFQFVGSVSSGPANLPQKQNEGHPGWRIDQIAAQADGWLAASSPDIVLLHIGTNDFEQDYEMATVADRLLSLLKQISRDAPLAHIYISSIIPILNLDDVDPQVQQFNQAIRRIVKSLNVQGKAVTFVDMYPALTKADYSSDGIHPTAGGYAKMAAVWFEAIGRGGPSWMMAQKYVTFPVCRLRSKS